MKPPGDRPIGPQLPLGAPRPVILPHDERWHSGPDASFTWPSPRGFSRPLSPPEVASVASTWDLPHADQDEESELPNEESDVEPPFENNVGGNSVELLKEEAADSTMSCGISGRAHPHCCSLCCLKTLEGQDKSFQQLLLDLAAEHHRSLTELRAEMEARSLTELRDGRECDQLPTRAPGEVSSVAHGSEMSAPDRPSSRQAVSFSDRGTSKDTATHLPELYFGDKMNSQGRLSPFDFVSEDSQGSRVVNTTEKALRGEMGMRYYAHWRTEALQRVRKDMSNCCHEETLDAMTSVIILLNACLVGWIANTSMAKALAGGAPDEVDQVPHILTMVFTAVFVLELCLRLHRSGRHGFFFGHEWAWNCFDAFIVFSDIVVVTLGEIGAEGAGAASNFTVLRIMRVLRITRAVRVLRFIRFFRELRMMVYSILHSGWSLTWSMILLAITMYGFAVYFVQAVAYHLPNVRGSSAFGDVNEEAQRLEEYFRNMPTAIFTLYQSISGGISWAEVVKPLMHINVVHGLVFALYTFFTTFALLNIITGIFVETSLASARSSQEELTQDALDATAVLVQEMKKLFDSADKDRSGSISLDEFEMYLNCKEVRVYLNALGIEMDKAKGLFQLLDLDGSGEITVEEFCFGCLRLKGYAKSIDLASLTNQMKRTSDHLKRFFDWTEAQFRVMHERSERVERRLGLESPGAPAAMLSC